MATRHSNTFALAFTFTACALLFVGAGAMGYNLSRHEAFVAGTAWTGHVLWWEVGMGVAAVPLALYFWRRALRSLARES